MSIFKIKKIISFSFLILFLISFALPFSVALAQDTQKADFYYTVVGLLDNKEHQLGPYTFLDCSQKLSDAKKNKLVTVKSVFCFEAKNGTGTQVTNITTNSNGSITSTTESVTVPTTTPSIVPESNYYPLAPLPGVGETCTQDKSTPPKTICIKTAATCTGGNCTPGIGFAGYLNVMINLFIGICAVLAMIMIVMGGIQYMTSELISGKEAGKEQVTHAVLGLLLALGAYAILNTINPDLLNIGLNKLPTASITVQPNSFIDKSTLPNAGTYSARCAKPTSGPCVPTSLSAFGSKANGMAMLCNVESGGTSIPSGVDKCSGPGGDGTVFSFGLFQINLLSNGSVIKNASGQTCNNLFIRASDGKDLPAAGAYWIPGTITYDCKLKPGSEAKYASCKDTLLTPAGNITAALELFREGGSFPQFAWSPDKSVCSCAFDEACAAK